VLCLEKVELIKKITEEIDNYDAVIILGAGDIYNIIKNGLTFN
jgi:UDP-N-acetylmuramate-alanine ligase